MNARVSIDLGTTLTKAGRKSEDGSKGPIMWPNRNTGLSSLAVVDPKGEIFTEEDAEASKELYHDRTYYNLKRYLGSGKTLGEFEDGTPYSAEDLIVAHLKYAYEYFLQEGIPTEVIVSIPPSFNEPGRKALKECYEMAGFIVIAMVNEDTCGLMFLTENRKNERLHYLLLDFGGGTIDVVLAMCEYGKYIILKHWGEKIGSVDLDNHLAEHLLKVISDQVGSDLTSDPVMKIKAQDEAKRIKERLTTREKTRIAMQAEGQPVEGEITQDQFYKIEEPVFEKIRGLVLKIKDEITEPLDEIGIVGNGSLCPRFLEIIEEIFPGVKKHSPTARGDAVSLGSLNYDTQKSSGQFVIPEVDEVTTHPLSIIVLEKANGEATKVARCLIPKNTPLSDCQFNVIAGLPSDESTSFKVSLTQAEDGTPVDACEFLDEWSKSGLKSCKDLSLDNPHERMKVRGGISKDGLVYIELTDTYTGEVYSFETMQREIINAQ